MEETPTRKEYEERISGLPKLKSLFGSDLIKYQGYYYIYPFLFGLLRMQDLFKAQPSDVFIASFPKSGTTWLKALVFAIVNRAHYEKETHPLLTKVSHECIPTLECDVYKDYEQAIPLENEPSPRLLSTHVPYTSLPKSMIDSNSKIIYISRDSKDVLISYHHFLSKVIPQIKVSEYDSEFDSGISSLENAYNDFCKGFLGYGPYWDHVLSYWKASIERPRNVLLLKYEDMKKDPQIYVKKLAEFVGKPFSMQEEEKGEVQRIVDLCSFEFLSRLQVSKNGRNVRNFTNDAFYRKGDVGDWKNYLTLDMAEHLDQITKQKLDGHGLVL